VGLVGKQIVRDANGTKDALSIFLLAPYAVVSEEDIISERSPVFTGQPAERTFEQNLFKLLLPAPAAQSGTQKSASETYFQVCRPRPVVTAEYAPQTIGLHVKALNCRRIVGVGNPRPLAPTSWWSGGDSN
jgi:hypothetical protein